ncbi:hypothetical protein C7H19_20180 [Aphanothece hegewaldii CCALA 016]|uniref:Uncharacterized protein n=1 Tax=Aphanothece hegewaldii CCALA 016 TaxID=2107694 RepID=A0A2T1LT77_9CHRO|nr:HEPN domain-containing protein [Aphanothece hegewaldii]PSF33319.1 hypothetical protein C7H19_20180 [Aphanothece hegewaldii CCALA 016]
MQSFEKDGIWFLPETPDKERFGRIKFYPNQPPKLDLVGELKDLNLQEKFNKPQEFPIIHGYLIGNNGISEKITLYNCYQPISLTTGIETNTIYADFILQGHHFISLDEFITDEVIVSFYHLEEWINLPNLKIEGILSNLSASTFQEIKIIQNIMETLEIGTLLDCSINLIDIPTFEPHKLALTNFLGLKANQIYLIDRKKILIKSKQFRNFKYYIKIIELLQEFFTFASGNIIYPSSLESYILVPEERVVSIDLLKSLKSEKMIQTDIDSKISEPNNKKQVIIQKMETPIKINIFYQTFDSLDRQNNNFQQTKVLFYFNNIQEQSNIILKNWEINRDQLSSIIELYLRLIYLPLRHINDWFLTLAQSIEGFHRIDYEGRYCDEETFEKIKTKLKDTFLTEFKKYNIGQSYHKSLLNKINYWNEYSLKERLEDLFSNEDFYKCLPDNFFIDSQEQEKFVKQVRDTRGSLTHPDSNTSDKKIKKKNKHIVTGQDLEKIVYKLKIILEACLLKQLGLDSSQVKTILSQKYKFG